MPRTTSRSGGNLPVELTSFVGRRRDLDKIRRLLGESRLVTLTGVGGTGKTRLALRAATELGRAFPDGAWVADLTLLRPPEPLAAQVQDPQVLAHLVMTTLGVREQPGGAGPTDQLVQYLADRRCLLVLDNCEHLLPPCAVLADTLRRGCAGLRILATSREPLFVPGEVLFAVRPLPTPELGQRPALDLLGRVGAVDLFVTRAQAVAQGFALSEENATVVAELCRRLDGLPLAIELAAARVRVLTPGQILARLTERFALLDRGSRSAPERQQTLRACVDWSFDLCNKPERLLWARLSVFVGGFELDAIEGVCADEVSPSEDLVETLTGLIDKSIVHRVDIGGGVGEQARYQMLETMQQYGEQRLIQAGEQSVLRLRHRDWYRRLVARAHTEWVSDRQLYWVIRLGREHANLRRAVEYCLTEPGGADDALRIVTALPLQYWWARGLFGEGRRWLDLALAAVSPDGALAARALLIHSQLAFAQGDADAGTRLLNEGEALAFRVNAKTEIGHAGYLRGMVALFSNDLAGAVRWLTHAWKALATEPERDLDLDMTLLVTLGVAAGLAGDRQHARLAQREMLTIVESQGGALHRAVKLWAEAIGARQQGHLEDAFTRMVEALQLIRPWTFDSPYNVGILLEITAWIAADRQQYPRAAVLLAAAGRYLTQAGIPIASHAHFVKHHEGCDRQLRDALGEAAFTDATRRGQTLLLEEVLAYAVEEKHRPAPSLSDNAPLTRRERQVADLIADGLSNKEIAAALVISQRTAESHVEHILAKLGLNNRAQVAARMAAQRWTPVLGDRL